MYTLLNNGIRWRVVEPCFCRRQANGTFYRLNGAIFIADIRRYHEDRFLYRKGSYAYIMKQSRSIDIDGELDFRLAEFFLANGIVD